MIVLSFMRLEAEYLAKLIHGVYTLISYINYNRNFNKIILKYFKIFNENKLRYKRDKGEDKKII